MANGKISVWQLSQDQIDTYMPGMDLGPPHEIQTYEPRKSEEEKKKALERVHRGVQARRSAKVMLTEELYNLHKQDGLSDKEIAAIYEIKRGTVTSYKSLWRKGEKL